MTHCPTHQPYLLLVEDDDVDAMAVQRGLRRHACAERIHRERDGESALRFLRRAPSPLSVPLVLLVDINVPRLNGLELIRELRRERAYDEVEIFVLTTSKLPEDRTAAAQLGVAHYHTKEDADQACRNVAAALLRAAARARAQDEPV